MSWDLLNSDLGKAFHLMNDAKFVALPYVSAATAQMCGGNQTHCETMPLLLSSCALTRLARTAVASLHIGLPSPDSSAVGIQKSTDQAMGSNSSPPERTTNLRPVWGGVYVSINEKIKLNCHVVVLPFMHVE